MTTVPAFLDIASRRILQLGFLLLALFVPFSIAGTNIALGFVALGWILVTVLRRLDRSQPQVPSAARDPMFIASLLLALSALPSALMSDNQSRALSDWRSHWQLIIYFGVAMNVAACGMRDTVFRVLAVSTILACGVAFIQRAGGLDVGPLHIGAQHRVGGTLYTMTFAGILAHFAVFFGAFALSRGLFRSERVVVLVSIACQLVALVLTMTRGAWLALAGGFVALVALLRSRAVVVAGAVILAALVAFTFLHAHDEGRQISIAALFGSSPDRNVHTRLALWKAAWELFEAHPLLGVGMGDYSEEADRLLAGVEGVLTTVDTHNIPLHILATRGIVGFIPFVYFWVSVFRVLARERRRSAAGSRGHCYAVGATAAAVAILVGSLTENNIDDEEVWGAFMLLLGLARARAYLPAKGADDEPPPQPPPPQTPR